MTVASLVFWPVSSAFHNVEGGRGKPLQTLHPKKERLNTNFFNSLQRLHNPNKTLTVPLHVRFYNLLKLLHIAYIKPLKINRVRKLLENVRKFSNTYPQLKPLINKE